MRKIILSGVAALGFLAAGITVMGHAATVRQAMIDTGRGSRPVLVADADPAPADTHVTMVAMMEPPDPC